MTQTTLRDYLRTTEDAISSGRIEEAMANCQNILTYFPEALEAQRLLGEVYLALGQLEEARQTFEWVLTNDPENVIVYCDRALISERTSDIDTALDCYQQAYELSRGNANIRQEFNQLSARVGQQEFMFSRAGLARLYMRGDLLTQAIQEWDAVLAISPERLDARLGLMETYWREGVYDKAEALATQLLEEIPTCLKALLYLAHIVSISNIQRTRELLQRAEALDPDLTMAQEVFADLVARQPNDPFLQLIKKEPILLENGVPIHLQAVNPGPSEKVQPPLAPQNAPLLQSSQEPQEIEMWDAPTQEFSAPMSEPGAEIPASADWGSNATVAPNNTNEQALPAWQDHLDIQAPPTMEEQPWYQNNQFTAPANPPLDQNWAGQGANASSSDMNWSSDAQEEQPAHPAWLDALTKHEQQATEDHPQEPVSPPPAAAPLQKEIIAEPPTQQAKQSQPEEEAAPFSLPMDEENEMGWPEWLKSLGAEALEPEQNTSSEPLLDIDATPRKTAGDPRIWEAPQPLPEADPWSSLPAMSASNDTLPGSNNQPEWMQQLAPQESIPTQSATPEWMQSLPPVQSQSSPADTTPEWMRHLTGSENQPASGPVSANMSPFADEQEQRYITSLEQLEKGLQSQGFTPLEPGALASIAQAQQSPPISPSEPAQPLAEPPLSSALEQLGNLSPSSVSLGSSEPWWNTMTSSIAEQSARPSSSASEDPTNPFAALGVAAGTVPQPFAPLPATPMPIVQEQPFPAGAHQEVPPPASTPLMSAYRPDPFIDNDLETTMKRPAITLQPMPASMAQGDRPYGNGKGRGERRHFEQSDESNLSSRERLVKGYQYQLSGAYEEAMQEYRLIIRNAPELLDDVISNMRALLKINPRFSLGYRVLGDAYMRKGEYLQAMESYNKALTMAKKAKS